MRTSGAPTARTPRAASPAAAGPAIRIDLSFTFCSYAPNRCRVGRMADNLLLLVGAIVLAGLAALAVLVVIARLQAETAVRVEAMRDMLVGRQAELHRAVNERLDSVTHHLNQSMTTTRQHTVESLQKLNERLAVIDNAQRNITDLASQVTSLQSVLANKQQRGAFGQGRMEFIVQDGLPKGCYEFQFTLSNK